MYRGKYRLIIPFLLPALLLYGLFVVYPYLRAMYVSLTNWSGISPTLRFIGLRNFQRLFQDQYFWNALRHNATYLVTLPFIIIALALFFAFVITQGVRLSSFYRIAFFFPQVMSVVAVGVLWNFVYHPTIGVLNAALRLVGVSNPPSWLGHPGTALAAVGAVVVWQAIGFYMVFFIAGMEGIPVAFYEVGADRGRLRMADVLAGHLPAALGEHAGGVGLPGYRRARHVRHHPDDDRGGAESRDGRPGHLPLSERLHPQSVRLRYGHRRHPVRHRLPALHPGDAHHHA